MPISIIPDPADPSQNTIFDPSQHKLPDFIERHSFRSPSSPRRVVFYTAKAENEKGIIVGGSGLKNDFPIPPDKIKELNDAGYSIIWLALPNPVRDHEFFKHYLHIAEEVLTDPKNPIIREWLNSDTPKVFFGYSTSAQIFYHLMREKRSFDHITNEFKGAVLASAYVRPPGAEYDYGLKALVLRAMATKFPDHVSLETKLGAAYYISGFENHAPPGLIETIKKSRTITIPDALIENQEFFTPTFFQMVELMKHGSIVKGDFGDKSSLIRNRGDFPILSMAGRDDPFASSWLNRKHAQQAGFAHYESPNGQHALPYEDTNFSGVMIAGLDAMLNEKFDQFAAGLKTWDNKVNEASKKFIGPPHSVMPFLDYAAADASP